MTSPASPFQFEHPSDVLKIALQWFDAGNPVALAVVSGVQGGGVRTLGDMMAVRADGAYAGYLSGGCVDSDIITQAQACIDEQLPRRVRYGADSPYADIVLPCGGALDINIFPVQNGSSLQRIVDVLATRSRCDVQLAEDGLVPSLEGDGASLATYKPKLTLRVAGRGADATTIFAQAVSCGLNVSLWSNDEACLRQVPVGEGISTHILSTPTALPACVDDPYTAFILLYHDPYWEDYLLDQALNSQAFYIGAVGSARTHARRLERLRERGASDEALLRVRGPIGLVPSLRSASFLAVSVLAEIIQEYEQLGKNVP